jgi:hypothetical protein
MARHNHQRMHRGDGRPRSGIVIWLSLAALVALLGVGLQRSLLADAPPSDEFQEQLAAGEFAPALRAAEGETDAADRDGRLVQLAKAQAQVGESDAAFSTLASVYDDLKRNDALKEAKTLAPAEGSRGGMANFSQLIQMITNTVKPLSWEDGGGEGRIEPFNNGVYVDASGVLKRSIKPQKAEGLAVARLEARKAGDNTNARLAAGLRKVSLPRLEKHVQLALAKGQQPSDEMLHLAGLEKIKYVLVYPETGDLVLAGPASAWRRDAEGRDVSTKTGRPVIGLDDVVVMLRYFAEKPQGTFGCSINPTEEGLAKTKQFAQQSSAAPLKPGQRPAWLKKIREQMGRQTITVDGIDPRTRVAKVLVEADYRMKLVGMGLEEGTVDVPSYLHLVKLERGQSPPALDVLRWWFTLKYDAVQATEARDAYELRGSGVQVKSENELLTDLGQQVHTGQSDAINAEFAHRFTEHFASLAAKYPVYADLQNMFDLALVSALVQSEKLADQTHWHMTCFLDPGQYQVVLGAAPTSVDSVLNHRVLGGKHILVGVSGGVHAQPWSLVKHEAIATDTYGKLQAERVGATVDKDLPLEAWWWD